MWRRRVGVAGAFLSPNKSISATQEFYTQYSSTLYTCASDVFCILLFASPFDCVSGLPYEAYNGWSLTKSLVGWGTYLALALGSQFVGATYCAPLVESGMYSTDRRTERDHHVDPKLPL